MIFNLREVELEAGDELPEGRQFAGRSLTGDVGAVLTGMGVYELAPREAHWPYHFELGEEEWLIVIDGEVTLRTPEGERVLAVGDVACFPPGAAGAHSIRNHTDAPARVAMPSTRARHGAAVIYPDSGKFSVYGPGFRHRGFLGAAVPYWEGET